MSLSLSLRRLVRSIAIVALVGWHSSAGWRRAELSTHAAAARQSQMTVASRGGKSRAEEGGSTGSHSTSVSATGGAADISRERLGSPIAAVRSLTCRRTPLLLLSSVAMSTDLPLYPSAELTPALLKAARRWRVNTLPAPSYGRFTHPFYTTQFSAIAAYFLARNLLMPIVDNNIKPMKIDTDARVSTHEPQRAPD